MTQLTLIPYGILETEFDYQIDCGWFYDFHDNRFCFEIGQPSMFYDMFYDLDGGLINV